MKKTKIMALLLSGAMVATMTGSMAISQKSNKHKTIKNNILLSAPAQTSNYGAVINGNDNLVLTNKSGQAIGYVSVGQMLKLGQNTGNSTKVTVEETGSTGYISNSNINYITSGTSSSLTRMNRKGSVVNVSTDVNVRSSATMNSSVLSTLTNNTALTITGKQGDWYRVNVNGIKGFVFSEYVAQLANSTATSSVPTNSTITTSNVVSNINPNNTTPVANPSNTTPVANPSNTTPVVKPSNPTPVVKPSNPTPVVKPSNPTPVVKPSNPTPVVKPSNPTPVVKPSNPTPVVKPSNPTPVVKPSNPTPVVKPSNPTPVVKPSNPTPVVKPSNPTPVVKPSNPTPVVKPSNPTPVVKPSNPTPVVKPSNPTPVVKPSNPTPVVKPSNPTPVVKPTHKTDVKTLSIKGLDLSNYQGNPDLSQAKKAGYDTAIILAGDGYNNFTSPTLEKQYQSAKKANMNIGFYYVLRPDLSIAQQAQNFWNDIKGKSYDVYPVLDVEIAGANQDVTGQVLEFMKDFKSLSGLNCIIYTGYNFANTHLNSKLAPYKCWIADWGISSVPSNNVWNKKDYVGWQYTGSGKIEGLSNSLDLDKFNSGIYINPSDPYVVNQTTNANSFAVENTNVSLTNALGMNSSSASNSQSSTTTPSVLLIGNN
ncbi:MAG: GH25 family lysozyme [Sarcina sp.]